MRWLKTWGGDDHGATAVVMALLMTALVGFTGLAVDGAATMAKHQELQNGADAAALAAAAECGKNGCGAIDAVAGPYGVDNVRSEKGDVETAFDVDLGAQTVTATVSGRQTHWFLPVVGIGSSMLEAEATASWFKPTSGPAMLPLAFSECSFAALAGGVPPGTEIVVWMPKDNKHTPNCPNDDYPPGGFGWLEVTDGKCKSYATVGDDINVIKGDNGMNHPKSCDFEDFEGKTVLIPIFGYADGSGSSGTYAVTQFAAFRITGLNIQTAGQWGKSCGKTPASNGLHDTCVVGQFLEYVANADEYEGEPDESAVAIVQLVD